MKFCWECARYKCARATREGLHSMKRISGDKCLTVSVTPFEAFCVYLRIQLTTEAIEIVTERASTRSYQWITYDPQFGHKHLTNMVRVMELMLAAANATFHKNKKQALRMLSIIFYQLVLLNIFGGWIQIRARCHG